MISTQKFPEGFLWGAATAGYQVEGYNENTDWAEAAREGKVPPAGRLADHYHRYEEDFDLLVELGHNSHRFGVEWGRIEPREGEFDQSEIEHYRQVLKALKKRNIVPYVTLWHFTVPIWFAERGGFEASDSPEIFARYCKHVVSELGDLCEHFATINEPNVYAGHSYIYGAWPPFKRGRILWKKIGKEDGTSERTGAKASFGNILRYFKVEKHLIKAHNQAYVAIKELPHKTDISIVKHVRYFHANENFINKLKARVMTYLQTVRYMNRIKDNLDSIGLNYYRHTLYGDNKNYLLSDMGWQLFPSGIYGALMLLKRYNLPIIVSEAGIADADDDIRAQYLMLQIKGIARALESGVDVRGHQYWSLMDNYEWALGTEKRFGLIEINYETLERTIRPSAHVYKKIIANNGILEE